MLKILFLLTLLFLSGCSVEYSEDLLFKTYKKSLEIESAYVQGNLDMGTLLSASFRTAWRHYDSREQYLTASIANQSYALYENKNELYILHADNWVSGKEAVDVLLAQSYLISLSDLARPQYFLESLLDFPFEHQGASTLIIYAPKEHTHRLFTPFMPPVDPLLEDIVYRIHIKKDYSLEKIEITYSIILPGTKEIPVSLNLEYFNINQTDVSIPKSLQDVLGSP